MNTFNSILIFIISTTFVLGQSNNAMLEVESTTQGVIFPRMDSTARKAIPTVNGTGVNDDGLLVYDTDYHTYYYYDGVLGTWFPLQGSAGQGPPGPQGPVGMSNSGAQGPGGDDGLDCWDLNGDGFFDAATEDKNGNNIPDAYDCKGPNGPQGSVGNDGPAGLPGVPGALGPGVQMAQQNVSPAGAPWYDYIDATIPSTAKVFVQNLSGNVAPFFVGNNGSWFIATIDFSAIPAGTVVNIIWVP